MDHITWVNEPDQDQPILLVAFTGWNDAGDAASGALAWLAKRCEITPLASLDPEPFFDFSATRPHIRLENDGSRSLRWPSNNLLSATFLSAQSVANKPVGDDSTDTNPNDSNLNKINHPKLALLMGTEPQLKWRTFTQQIVTMTQRLRSPLVVTLGALLADVPHTRPSPVYGSSQDPELAAQLELSTSRYEGPTGIVGVLNGAYADVGLRTASLWAAVPNYTSEIPSPKASFALIKRVCKILDITPDTSELEELAATYEHHVSNLVIEADDAAKYITQLEQDYDNVIAQSNDIETMRSTDPSELVTQIEEYLRNQPS
ncbi:MAG: PAC2 family protein [Acidimicrobiia bacterium]|nr:PAC2 family protein [Acidimicrobiia bacterium]MYC57984.1 PAC2 family protein [Acidimicrobiia bacterium]MYI31067.1 PAC2 family protein [Acidimicrobiia bacterium]